MGQIAPEITIVRMSQEVKRWAYPSIELRGMDMGEPAPIGDVNNPSGVSFRTYQAKVHIFRKYIPSIRDIGDLKMGNYEETRLALDEQAQQIVDMFVDSKARELQQVITQYQIANGKLEGLYLYEKYRHKKKSRRRKGVKNG